MRIVWHSSSPLAGTGYGGQTRLFTPRLRDAGHDVTLSATWGINGAMIEWEGMTVYPSDEKWGNMMLPDIAARHKPCQVITLVDVWVLQAPVMRMIDNLACWVPVDHDPLPPKVAGFLRDSGARPIAMSRFGEQALTDAGLSPLYVPHGVDTNVFKPVEDREALREQMRFPDDVFVIGVVANNMGFAPSRKAFPEIIMAFSEFRRRHENAFLYLHTNLTGARVHSGVNVVELCETFGVPIEAVGFSPQFELEVGAITDADLASLYASFDVLLNPSYGEGFGIPLIEAQACGTPVIATDWTAMTELVGPGWLVQGEPSWDQGHHSLFMAPNIGQIVEALEAAYVEADGLRGKAHLFGLQYDADLVTTKHWLPTLEALDRPVEIPPLAQNGNRAQRRAAKKAKVNA
jgi:glycosyltransferase involved in cell wall biosynthesis